MIRYTVCLALNTSPCSALTLRPDVMKIGEMGADSLQIVAWLTTD